MNIKKEILSKIKGLNTIENISMLFVAKQVDYKKYFIYNNFQGIPENDTYDNGFGGQELFGRIEFSNGDVMLRDEYDGAESWRYIQSKVVIDEKLKDTINNGGYVYIRENTFDNLKEMQG